MVEFVQLFFTHLYKFEKVPDDFPLCNNEQNVFVCLELLVQKY